MMRYMSRVRLARNLTRLNNQFSCSTFDLAIHQKGRGSTYMLIGYEISLLFEVWRGKKGRGWGAGKR